MIALREKLKIGPLKTEKFQFDFVGLLENIYVMTDSPITFWADLPNNCILKPVVIERNTQWAPRIFPTLAGENSRYITQHSAPAERIFVSGELIITISGAEGTDVWVDVSYSKCEKGVKT